MNLTAIIAALVTGVGDLTKLIPDIEAAVKAIQADKTLSAKVQDALKGLSQAVADLANLL